LKKSTAIYKKYHQCSVHCGNTTGFPFLDLSSTYTATMKWSPAQGEECSLNTSMHDTPRVYCDKLNIYKWSTIGLAVLSFLLVFFVIPLLIGVCMYCIFRRR